MINRTKLLLLVVSGFFLVGQAFAKDLPQSTLAKAIGRHDSILVKNMQDGTILFAANSDKPLIPASIIKIVTSLAAFHYLGEDSRFFTECYQREDGALIISGQGDPCFVSEEIDRMAAAVSRVVKETPGVAVDYSCFAVTDIPGRGRGSLEPYDAPNGALCANYNTVAFMRENGRYVSAEPQTPLLPFAIDRIRSMSISPGRIMIFQNQKEAAFYAAELFSHFLAVHGCRVDGPVVDGQVDHETDRFVYRHISRKTLREIVAQLLLYSNNFTANQLLLSCGVKKYGPPATLEKGLQAAQSYFREDLHTRDIKLAEGSGLSVDNRVSAEVMCLALDAFAPYLELLRKQDNEYYKTGTLTNVSTRAGYIITDSGRRFQYVIMLNTPGKTAERLMPAVKQLIRQADRP